MKHNYYIIEFSCPARWNEHFRTGVSLEGVELLGWHTVLRCIEEAAIAHILKAKSSAVSGVDLNFHAIALVHSS